METALIAPCGLNCALCSAYLARKLDLKKHGIRRSYCEGCRPRGKNCVFLKQSCERLGNGRVQYCYECPEYPCRRLKQLDRRYRTNYHVSVIENLDFIRDEGIEKFVEREEVALRGMRRDDKLPRRAVFPLRDGATQSEEEGTLSVERVEW